MACSVPAVRMNASWRMFTMYRQWWQRERLLSLAMRLPFSPVRTYHLLAALTGVFLLGVVACGQSTPRTNAPASSPYVNLTSPRNHVPPNGYWGLVHVTFTAETTYAQANTVLNKAGMDAYPMVNPPCGDLREVGAPIPVSPSTPAPAPTPMSPEALRMDFQHSHRMLVQTDAWEKLNRVAAEPAVVSVDPFPLPKSCPAQAPI